MITLYSAPRTRSIRIAWLLEEMQLDYRLVNGEFRRTSSEFFIQDTPTGKYPTLDDDGMVMFESGAIAEYLLEKYDAKGLAPAPGSDDRGEFLQWMYFADATAYSPLGIVAWLTLYRDDQEQNSEIIKDALNRARTGFQLLEDHLSKQAYVLTSGFSAADIMIAFTLLSAKALGALDEKSVLNDYLARLMARPAFQLAMKKTGNV